VVLAEAGATVVIGQAPEGMTAAERDVARLEANYLRRVQIAANALPLAAIDPRAVERTRQQTMDLLPVYVALNTTTIVPAEGEKPTGKRRERPVEAMPGMERETRPLPALEAVARERLMVLLGDPGGGKSTFVNYLALCLAGGRLEELGEAGAVPGEQWLAHLAPAWTGGPLLPLPIVLRQFARSRWCDGSAAGLWGFVAETLAGHDLGDFATVLHQRLQDGGVIVLLDGLDEVADPAQRSLVRDAVTGFVATHGDVANRYLVTCRGYAYQDPCCRLDRFAVHTLAPFDQEQIDAFVGCWYGEVCRLGWKNEAEAQELTGRLRDATRRPDLAPLARNPLQLAMMASLHFSWGRLPDDRVELYLEMVRLLLVRWQEARLGQEAGVTQTISVGDLESALERVAFVAHRSQAGAEGTADIGQALLLNVFKDYLAGSWDRANALAAYIQDRAGLLLDRGGGTYTFPHRSYQEYLAGAYLAVQPDFPDQTASLVRTNYAQWREVALWAVGAMARLKKMTHVAVDVAVALCPQETPAPAVPDIEWRLAALAGEALLEIGLKEVTARERHRPVLARVQRWLLSLIERGALPPAERAAAGRTLGDLGDPRFTGDLLLPEFIPIPAGTFWMGSDAAEVERLHRETGQDWSGEMPRHQVALDAFALARYPTTNAMFDRFIRAGGYANPTWWEEAIAAGRWQDGKVRDYWGEDRYRPAYWDNSRFNAPNQPVVGVTWYEAVACCRWLTATLHDGHIYRLPTEAEWERAARGPSQTSLIPPTPLRQAQGKLFSPLRGERRGRGVSPLPSEGRACPEPGEGGAGGVRSAEVGRYPWGDPWAEDRCNSAELHLERATPVGIFPAGASIEGILDLAGNVWEWCSDWYAGDAYRQRAGRVIRNPAGPRSGDTKVLRGGSWYNDRNIVRCAYRFWSLPVNWLALCGFRVARSSR
jgi:formylglycine-generating enzyme required for sulfatase activity